MERECDICGASYTAKRATSRYCSTKCRTRASRSGQSNPVIPFEPVHVPEGVPSVSDATRAVLSKADRLSTPLGAAAMALAARIDDGRDSGSGLAAAVKALEGTLASALSGAEVKQQGARVSPMQAARERRDAKRRGA